MVRKQSAVKTGKKVSAEASTQEAPMQIPFSINPKHPHFWRMNFLPERGYELTNAHPSFESTVQNLNWEGFVQHRTYYLEQIVREFYAGLHTAAGEILPDYSMVRGTKVFFDEQTINEHYHLRYSGNSFDAKVESYGKKKMEQVKARICIPNAEWEKFSQNEFKMKIRYLIPELSNWHTFVNCSIMPTSHNYTLTKGRMIVLDCILLEEEINIGKIINKEIRDCAKKEEGFLFFPCLITALCIKRNVSISEMERTYRKKPPTALSAQMKARRVLKDPAELGKKEKMQKQKELKHEVSEKEDKREQALLKFLFNQHEWMKKRFDEIIPTSSSVEIPEFPKWMIKEEEKEKESEEKESEEEEPVGKKKKSLKRKKETRRKGKTKKKAQEEEWIEEESTEEEENPELKEMEKETDEEEENTTTEGSANGEKIDDFDLGLSLEEILRKKKAKSPVIEQINPSEETPSKTPAPQSSTPPSTGTTPPPPEKTTQEKEPTKEQTPPIDQPKEKSPPIQKDTPIISTDIVSETGTMQDLNESPKDKEATTVEEEKNEENSEEARTDASAPGASEPKLQPTVTEPVMSKIDETLNIVITQLAEKRRQELGNTQKFFKKTTGSLLGKATKQQEIGETVKEKVTGEEQEATAAGTATTTREEATLKDVAETLADLPGQVLEEPAKETEVQGSAQAPEASAPAPEDSDEVVDITPSQQPASGSKKGKKQKPKQTPTRSSSRLRSGAKPQ